MNGDRFGVLRRFKLAVVDDVISETDGRNTDEVEIRSFGERPVVGVWRQNSAKNNHKDHQGDSHQRAFEFRTPPYHPTGKVFLEEADKYSDGQTHVISNAEQHNACHWYGEKTVEYTE